jgi:hypothetical protein
VFRVYLLSSIRISRVKDPTPFTPPLGAVSPVAKAPLKWRTYFQSVLDAWQAHGETCDGTLRIETAPYVNPSGVRAYRVVDERKEPKKKQEPEEPKLAEQKAKEEEEEKEKEKEEEEEEEEVVMMLTTADPNAAASTKVPVLEKKKEEKPKKKEKKKTESQIKFIKNWRNLLDEDDHPEEWAPAAKKQFVNKFKEFQKSVVYDQKSDQGKRRFAICNYIRGLLKDHPTNPYANIHVKKIVFAEATGNTTIRFDGPGTQHCLIIGRDHRSRAMTMKINRFTGHLMQICYDEKCRDEHDRPKAFSFGVITDEYVKALFCPQLVLKNDRSVEVVKKHAQDTLSFIPILGCPLPSMSFLKPKHMTGDEKKEYKKNKELVALAYDQEIKKHIYRPETQKGLSAEKILRDQFREAALTPRHSSLVAISPSSSSSSSSLKRKQTDSDDSVRSRKPVKRKKIQQFVLLKKDIDDRLSDIPSDTVDICTFARRFPCNIVGSLLPPCFFSQLHQKNNNLT